MNKAKYSEKTKEKKEQKKIRRKKENGVRLPDKPCCHGCMYYSTDVHCCQYILVTGHQRPWPGGIGCKAKKRGKSPKLKAVPGLGYV